jgi:peptide/nickel transport system ATP-binding protein
MRNGEVVEQCPARELAQAKHPYTRALLSAMPRLDEDRALLPVMERDAV